MDTKIIAPYILRSYIWAVLQQNTDMKQSDYKGPDEDFGIIPIVPLAEEPELTQFDKPYLVYGYSESANPDLFAQQKGNMSFIIYSTNFRELSRIVNVIARTFERMDEAASDVNKYSSAFPEFHGLRFGTVGLSFVEGGSPETSEGGRQSAAVTIRYEYFANHYDEIRTTPVVNGNSITEWV